MLAAIVGAMLACFTALILMRPVEANETRQAAPSHYAAPADATVPDKTSMAASERIVGNVGW